MDLKPVSDRIDSIIFCSTILMHRNVIAVAHQLKKELPKIFIDDDGNMISSSLSSYHEKATPCVGRIQTRLGVAFVFEFSG